MRPRVPSPGDKDYEAVRRIIDFLTRARQQFGFSQADIGLGSGYSTSGISELESMKTPLVSLLTLVRYVDAMDMELHVTLRPKEK